MFRSSLRSRRAVNRLTPSISRRTLKLISNPDDQVDSVGRFEHYPLVDDWNCSLRDELQADGSELELQTRYVRRFEQPRSQRAVHLYCSLKVGSDRIVKFLKCN